jgi:hypothetical protein
VYLLKSFETLTFDGVGPYYFNKIENLSVEGCAGACRRGGIKGKVRNENRIELIQMVVLIKDCRR